MADAPNELQGWKEIAAYLGRSTRAAQRWEAQYGLPVRRVGGTVFADRAELDAWKRSPRGQSAAHAPGRPDEDEAVAPQAAAVAATPPAADSRPREQVPLQIGPPTFSSRWSARRRLWLTAATLAGAATVAAVLLLTLGNSTAGWVKRGAAPPPAPGWDRAGLDAGPWAAVYHDARQSAQGHHNGPAQPAAPLPLLDAPDVLSPTQAMVATTQGLVIAGTCDGRLFGVRLDGSLAWASTLDREPNAESAFGFAVSPQGLLAVSTGECPHNLYANVRTQLHLRRAHDGASAFRLRTGAMNLPPALSADSIIYQLDQYNTLRALGPLGDVLWTVDLPGFGSTPPVLAPDGTLFVATDGQVFGHRAIWAVSARGTVLWNRGDGILVRLAADLDGRLYGLDANIEIGGRPVGPVRLVSYTPSGDVRWRREIPESTFAGQVDTLVLGPAGPVLRTADAVLALTRDGSDRWRAALPPGVPRFPGTMILDRDETAYVSAGDEVIAIDRDGRERWRVPVPQAGRIILAGEGLLAVTSANRRILLVHDRGIDPARLAPHDTP